MSTFTGTGTTVVLTTTIPADNADLMASDINVPLETLFDNDAALQALANGKVSKAGDGMTGELVINTNGATSLSTSGPIATNGDLILVQDSFILSITGMTNAVPCVVTTAAPHGLQDGDLVTISGVGSPTAAAVNRQWVVEVSSYSTTTFALVETGISPPGVYTPGAGVVQRNAQATYATPRAINRMLNKFWNSGCGPQAATITEGWYIGGSVVSACAFVNYSSSPTTQSQIWGADIELPQGSTLASATVYFTTPPGHAGLPAFYPTLIIYKIDRRRAIDTASSPPNPMELGSSSFTGTFGTPATVGAYEQFYAWNCLVFHGNGPAAFEIVDNETFRYFVMLTTETGTNAIAGTVISGAQCTASVTSLEQF